MRGTSRAVPMLLRAGLRHALAHPWLFAFAVLGVALGVSVVVAVDLANGSARRAFLLSAEAVGGSATHRMTGPDNSLDEQVYVRLKRRGLNGADVSLAPVIEGTVELPGAGGDSSRRTLRLLGLDPFSELPFGRPTARALTAADNGAFVRLLAVPGATAMSEETARRSRLKIGDRFSVATPRGTQTLTLVSTFPTFDAGARQAWMDLALVDLSTAQETLGLQRRLSHIDVRVTAGVDGDRAVRRLEQMLPSGVTVTRSGGRARALDQLTRAFSLNLTALSLLSLVVGMFLIYNAVSFSVVQRRRALAIFRALGISRRELLVGILGEAAGVALLGSAVGLGAGVALSRLLVELVTRTISDLYFVLQVNAIHLSPWTLAKGLGLGIGATLLAALIPALEAARTSPLILFHHSAAEHAARGKLWRLTALGIAVGACGVAAVALPSRSLILAYVGLFAILAGSALLVPISTLGLSAAARPIWASLFGLTGRMATRSIVTQLGRNAVAIAALTVAVATTVSVALMVSSFRSTVVSWLDQSLVADVFVAPASTSGRGGGQATLSPWVVQQLTQLDRVERINTLRRLRAQTSVGEVDLQVVDHVSGEPLPYRLKQEADRSVDPLSPEGSLMISEPFAFRHSLEPGATLQINTDRGWQQFRVSGVFYDYASDAGAAVMARNNFEPLFDDRQRSGVALTLAKDDDPDAFAERLRDRLRADGLAPVEVRSNRALKAASLEIFDRTFTVTRVLRLLAVAVAFVGALTALMALALERTRELATLRALGLLPRQLFGLITLQSTLLGLFAGLLALPLGGLLAWVLIHAVNRRSFGWSLELTISPGPLLEAIGLAVTAAILAGLYPSWSMQRVAPARALREE